MVAEEVLDRVGALAARSGGAHRGVQREQRPLQVTARSVSARCDAEVAADRPLAADLVVREIQRTGGERRHRAGEVGERADRKRGAERDGASRHGVGVEARTREHEHTIGVEASVADVRQDDSAARDDRDARSVPEQGCCVGR